MKIKIRMQANQISNFFKVQFNIFQVINQLNYNKVIGKNNIPFFKNITFYKYTQSFIIK